VDQLAFLAKGRAFGWIATCALALSACNAETRIPGPRPVANGIEFQTQAAPPGVEAEPAIAIARAAVAGIDREFGMDISRQPDVLEYGIARCSEAPSCLGAEAGTGPWMVWHIKWQPIGSPSWIALLLDPATGESIWIGAG
jgi:hypothetical protein